MGLKLSLDVNMDNSFFQNGATSFRLMLGKGEMCKFHDCPLSLEMHPRAPIVKSHTPTAMTVLGMVPPGTARAVHALVQ